MKIITFLTLESNYPEAEKRMKWIWKGRRGWEEICLSRAAQKKRNIRPIRRDHSTSEGRDGLFWKKNPVSIFAPKTKTKFSRTKILHTTTAENKTFTHENPAHDNCGKQNFHARAGKKNEKKYHAYICPEKNESVVFFKEKSYFSSLKSQTLLSQISFGLNNNLRGVNQQHTLQSSLPLFQYS